MTLDSILDKMDMWVFRMIDFATENDLKETVLLANLQRDVRSIHDMIYGSAILTNNHAKIVSIGLLGSFDELMALVQKFENANQNSQYHGILQARTREFFRLKTAAKLVLRFKKEDKARGA